VDFRPLHAASGWRIPREEDLMSVVWPVIFGIVAALFGGMAYSGVAHGWVLLAKVLFSVCVLAFAMALLIGQLVVRHIS